MPSAFSNRVKSKVDAREELVIPTYTLGRKPRSKGFRRILITISILALLLLSIYLPPYLLDAPDTSFHASVDLTASADRQAMEDAQTYLRNNPDSDFDRDGLTNEEEVSANTGVYLPDNDGDGTSDYAELYLTETNPRNPDDSALNFVINADAKTGNAVNTPFKVNDVVLWADDYSSKARGSVLRLSDGSYVFNRFQGWAQFPTGKYAYKVVEGSQVALETNQSGYFYIDTPQLLTVRVYEEQPAPCHLLALLGSRYTLADNFFTRALSFILPSRGFGLITCRSALVNDFDGTWEETATANASIAYHPTELKQERFSKNQLTLPDLASIFHQIDSGNTVILSLMSHEWGESLVEVYGYTNRNNLLVCDPSTGEQLGVINITAYSERILDVSGTIQEYEQFAFSGCGYSSAARHRIAIIDILTPSGTKQLDEAETEIKPESNPIVPPTPAEPTTTPVEGDAEPIPSAPNEDDTQSGETSTT